MGMPNSHLLYPLFARMLDYPTPDLVQQADECAVALSSECPGASKFMGAFHDQVEKITLERLQEIYTYTFDLQGTCPPYIGHQLFGESYKRSWFMARLNNQYHERDFMVEKELPDHIVVILNYLANNPSDEFGQVLEQEGLRPAVDKMLELCVEVDGNPYWKILQALSLVLQEQDELTIGSDLCN